MSIEGIKITRKDIENLNKSGNIYNTQENMENGNSVDINSMYFGDDGDIYVDNKGRIVEQQADGSQVYMGWTDKTDFSGGNQGKLEKPFNSVPLSQGKDDVITITPEKSTAKKKDELRTYVSDNKVNINSAYDYQKHFNKTTADTTPKNNNSIYLDSTDNITITPIGSYDSKKGSANTSETKPLKEIYLSDGKPSILIDNTVNETNDTVDNTTIDIAKISPYVEDNSGIKVAQEKMEKDYTSMKQKDTENKGVFNEENKLKDLTTSKTIKDGVEITNIETSEKKGIFNEENRLKPLTPKKVTSKDTVVEETPAQETPVQETITPIITSDNVVEEDVTMEEAEPQTNTLPSQFTDGLDIAMHTAFAEGAYFSEDAARKIADVIINRAVNRGLTLEGVVSQKGQFQAWRNGVKNQGNWGWRNYGSGPGHNNIGTERVQQIFMEELNKAANGQPLTYNYNYFNASGDNQTNIYW